MSGFVLDTHVWLWAQRRDTGELSPDSLNTIESWQRSGSAHISAISAWEIALLVATRRVELGMAVEDFLEVATQDSGLRLLPLTPRILIESTRLPGTLHRDPADRMLVATAREHGMTLVTRDKLLLQYAKQGHLTARKP